jgi:hypothetical protein
MGRRKGTGHPAALDRPQGGIAVGGRPVAGPVPFLPLKLAQFGPELTLAAL